MPRLSSALLLALFCLAAGAKAQEGPTTSHTALDGRLALEIPVALTPLTDAQIRAKYGVQTISEAFGDSLLAVTIATSTLPFPAQDGDIADVREAFDSQLREAYPDATWNRSEVVTQGGRPFALLDAWLPVGTGRVRNVMLIGALGDQLGIVTFNASAAAEPAWGDAGEAAIASVRFVD